MMCAVCMFDGRRQEELIDLKDGQIDQLRAERDNFYSDYRMKCDKETKALTVERNALRHDIERHVAICAEQAQEIDALAAQLTGYDAAREMLNVQDNQIDKLQKERDALAALLRELDETWIRSTCPQSIRDEIDAALAGDKP